MVIREVGTVRRRIGRAVFGMVAGPEGPDNRARIHDTPGPRWFTDDRPIRRVHGDASMFVGGLRALLLQSLHPLAMAG
ncbi:MAG TPA: oxygenase MpaB family protein, partial [Mycobacterium sp.]